MSRVWIAFAAFTAALIFYSQTGAFAWDEGFHLITAQLIYRGKTPYLDFFFPQTPLNAYWNALWMRVFGDTWRTAHAVAAVMTGLAVLATGLFLFRKTRNEAAALLTMAGFGLNAMVVQFGPVAQAYGLCLFLVVGAFRLVTLAVEGPGLVWAFGSGLFCGAAACSSLLTVPAAPVMWVWMLWANQAGSKVKNALAFILGCFAGMGPVWWLLAKDPYRTWFNVFTFNSRFRGVNWDDLWSHDISVFLHGIDSGQAVVLATGGILSLILLCRLEGRKNAWVLCAALSVAFALHISTAHPTFERYYMFVAPWLAILCGAGFAALPANRRAMAGAVLLTITVLGLGKSLYDERDSFTWDMWEQIAKKVDEVTPKNAQVQADEHVYLITRRDPPEGMEHENSHKPLPYSDAELLRLHIVSQGVMEKRINAGVYATIATCDEAKPVSDDILKGLYKNEWKLENCVVYWGFGVKNQAAQNETRR